MLTTRFAKEAELQEWLAAQLPGAKTEVRTNLNTRADIVLEDAVIECKLVLDRDKIHQAYSQARMYAAFLNKKQLILIGHPPHAYDHRISAENAAKALQATDRNLAIYWVEGESLRVVGYRRSSPLDRVGSANSKFNWGNFLVTATFAILFAGLGQIMYRNPILGAAIGTGMGGANAILEPRKH